MADFKLKVVAVLNFLYLLRDCSREQGQCRKWGVMAACFCVNRLNAQRTSVNRWTEMSRRSQILSKVFRTRWVDSVEQRKQILYWILAFMGNQCRFCNYVIYIYVFIFSYIYFILYTLLSLSGNFGCLTGVRLQQLQEQHYPVLQVHAGSFCVSVIHQTLIYGLQDL